MDQTDFALAVVGWTPFVMCVFASILQPKSWATSAKVIHASIWVLFGWGLSVAYVELAQFVATVRATTDQELLDLYSSDGAARAFASIFGWLLPLSGLVGGFAIRALSNRLLRGHDRLSDSTKRTGP